MLRYALMSLIRILLKQLLKTAGPRAMAYAQHLRAAHRAYRHAERHEQNRLRDEAVIRSLANQQRPARLHIGAGFNQIQGWINTDLEPLSKDCLVMDAGRPLPIDDGCLGYVFCEHLIEHLPRAQGVQLIQEAYRCLQPGGRIRIATPDLAVYVSLFAGHIDSQSQSFLDLYGRLLQDEPMTANKALNHVVRNWGHQFIWTKDDLKAALLSAGFAQVTEHGVGQSNEPALRDLERHQLTVDGEVNQLETMVLEAVKRSNPGETFR